MRILIDIGHPAHVHYFRNFTGVMRDRGHELFFSVRDKESAIALMASLDFKYKSRGKGGNALISKIFKLVTTDIRLYRMAQTFRPDVMLSYSSPYAAHVSRWLRVPHIALDDTEHAIYGHALYRPFTDVILSPSCYMGPRHRRQIFFSSYLELFCLHPNYFTPDPGIFEKLGLEKGESYTLLRLVAWNAHHDAGQSGFSRGSIMELIRHLERKSKVFISSEKQLESEFEPYLLNVHPSQFHDVLGCASLCIGEGSTTAAESSVLGTPSIYVNSLSVGYCTELEEKYGLCHTLRDPDQIARKAGEILEDVSVGDTYSQRRKKMLSEKIDPTAFLTWFVEAWPDSREVMLNNPDSQFRFL